MRFFSPIAEFLFASPFAQVAASGSADNSGLIAILTGLTATLAIGALVIALRARHLALGAAEEAGLARTRASQSATGGVSADALAATERVWSARITALEAQILTPSARSAPRSPTAAATDLTARLDELERTVNGLAVATKELRRAAPAQHARESSPSENTSSIDAIAWPTMLGSDAPPIRDVRQALAPAVKAGDQTAVDLLARLRQTERWPTAKPASEDLAGALLEISTLLLAVLRREGERGPLDAALLADRVLAALRPSWKAHRPQLDCRSMLPGSTFDPDWMEDRTATGARRPVIAEMLSWAVFEKLDTGRRILAKARVTTE